MADQLSNPGRIAQRKGGTAETAETRDYNKGWMEVARKGGSDSCCTLWENGSWKKWHALDLGVVI